MSVNLKKNKYIDEKKKNEHTSILLSIFIFFNRKNEIRQPHIQEEDMR